MKKECLSLSLLFVLLNGLLSAQENKTQSFSLQECIDYALKNNEGVKAVELQKDYYKQIKHTSTELPKTTAMFTQGQFNSIYKYDNNITIAQSTPFPGLFGAQNKLANAQLKNSEYALKSEKANLIYHIKTTYYSLIFVETLKHLLLKEDSIYEDFANVTAIKYRNGEASLLEKTSTETQVMDIKNQLFENEEDIINYQIHLKTLMNCGKNINIKDSDMENNYLTIVLDSAADLSHPILKQLNEQVNISERQKKVEIFKSLPDFTVGYFNQTIYGPANVFGEDYFLTTKNRLQGFQVGMTLPIWYYPFKAKINAADINKDIAQHNYNYQSNLLQGEYKQTVNQYLKYQNSITYYKKKALDNSTLMITEALDYYKKKEIGYVEYLEIVSQALSIKCNYLKVIHENNLTVLKLQYLLEN